MGALTFKILTNLWSNQTDDESCHCVSDKLRAVLDKYPTGGDDCLREICELAQSQMESAPLDEQKKWDLVYELSLKRV